MKKYILLILIILISVLSNSHGQASSSKGYFNGTKYLNYGATPALNLQDSITVQCTFEVDTFLNSWIFSKNNSSNCGLAILINATDTIRTIFGDGTNDSWFGLAIHKDIIGGTHNKITMTAIHKEGSSFVYVDTILIKSMYDPDPISYTGDAANFAIGVRNNLLYKFKGYIYDLKIYNRSLTLEDIKYECINNKPQSQASLLLWLDFNTFDTDSIYDNMITYTHTNTIDMVPVRDYTQSNAKSQSLFMDNRVYETTDTIGSLNGKVDFTMEFKVKALVGGAYSPIFSTYKNGVCGFVPVFYANQSLRVYSPCYRSLGHGYDDNKFHHIVIYYTAIEDSLCVFKDGIKTIAIIFCDSIHHPADKGYKIGRKFGNDYYKPHYYMKYIRVYHRVLTEEEIIYNSIHDSPMSDSLLSANYIIKQEDGYVSSNLDTIYDRSNNNLHLIKTIEGECLFSPGE